jgi:hypothetical protein
MTIADGYAVQNELRRRLIAQGHGKSAGKPA